MEHSTPTLPKRPKTTKLEQESLDRLSLYFPTDHFQIRRERESDAGIDLTIEIAGDHFTNRRFNAQMKSTDGGKIKSITRRIKTANLNYLHRSPLLGVYIFYVKKTQTYYYEWVHEFVESLNRNKKHWQSQKTHTLTFNKKLDIGSVKEISDRVERHAKLTEQFRSGRKIEKIIESFHNGKTPDHYTNIEWSLLTLIDTFEGISVMPNEILVKFPPFSLTPTSKSSFNPRGRTIHTDNPDLLKFFSALEMDGDSITRKDSVPINSESIKKIMLFLEYHLIHHIAPVSLKYSSDRVCIHNLQLPHAGCDCEKCSYKKLKWRNVIQKINEDLKKENSYDWMRRGYVYLELGKTKEAYLLYKELSDYAIEQRKYLTSIIAKYCLANMQFFIRTRYLEDDQQSILDDVSSIDLKLEIQNLVYRADIKLEVFSVLLWLVESDYIHKMYVEVDMSFENIRNAYHNDQRGGTTVGKLYETIVGNVTELTVFSEGNAFHYLFYNGFKIMTQKAVEAAIMMLCFQNPQSKKINSIDNYIVHLLLLYGDADQLDSLLTKYKINNASFKARHEEGEANIIQYIDNLLTSFPSASAFSTNETNETNFVPRNQLSNQLRIIAILVSIMDDQPRVINRITSDLLTLAIKSEPKTYGLLSGLRDIFHRKGKVLDVETYTRCYKWLITDNENDYDNTTLAIEIPYLLAEMTPNFVLNDSDIVNSVRNRIAARKSSYRRDYYATLAFWQVASMDVKSEIKTFVETCLNQSFDPDLYFHSVMEKIIDYNPLLSKFIECVPKTNESKEIDKMFAGYEDFRNRHLTDLIRLAFRFQIPLDSDSMQVLHDEVPYYKWLMNLGSFDYAKFDPYWILYNSNEDFIREFRKQPQIKAKIEEHLRQRPLSRLSEIYFHHFSRDSSASVTTNNQE